MIFSNLSKIKDGVTFEYLPTYWDVNTEAMEKTLSKDKYPPYVTKEKSIK